jgi:hypothetical protein
MNPEVVFRVKENDGKINFYVAYLFPDPAGNLYAVLSENTDGYGLEASPKLDPSLLVEQHDNVSEMPFYLYRGVIDARQLEFRRLQSPPDDFRRLQSPPDDS